MEIKVALDNKVNKQLATIKANIDKGDDIEGSNKDIKDIKGNL